MVTQTYNVNIDSKNYTRKEKEMKEKTTLSNVHKYIREYNETTGIQGLHYLTDKRSLPEKIVWGIILLISLSGCIWMIYEILQKYQNSPIVIGLANEPGFIHQIPFPAVTICPVKIISDDKFINNSIHFKLEHNISLTDEDWRMVDYERFVCPEKLRAFHFLKNSRNYTPNNESFVEFIKENSPSLRAHLSFCYFMDQYQVCEYHFIPVLTSRGICYSFNIMDRSEVFKKQVFHYKDFHEVFGRNSSAFDGETGYNGKIDINVYPQRALIPGVNRGLSFDLTQFFKENDDLCDDNLAGYGIRIHHPAETYDSVRENTYFLSLNKSTMISITPELIRTSDKIKHYNVDNRKCYLKGEKQLKYFQIYTQFNCQFECLTNITLNTCRCVDFYMPRMNDTEFICNEGFKSRSCIISAEGYLYQQLIDNNEANSGITKYSFACNCLPSCSELKYNLELTQAVLQNKTQSSLSKILDFRKKLPGESRSQLFINFKSSSFPILERNELYGTTDLISNFGGLLGLFTGFSFISLAEIIYYLTLRIWCNRRLYGQWTGPPD